MPDYHLIGPFGSDYPRALAGEGRRVGDRPDPAEVILRNFPAASWDAANSLYIRAKQVGIAVTMGGKAGRRMIGPWWQFGGITNHLIDAAVRLGISTGTIHRAEADPTLKNISTRIGEAYGRYTRVKGPTRDNRDFANQEIAVVRGLLVECDKGIARLFAMAAAAVDAAEECREAHGMPPGEYRYRIVGSQDEATADLRAELDAALADVGRLNGEALSRAELHRADLDRLQADNAELLGQNRQLAAMVESLTAPAPAPADPDGAVSPIAPDPSPALEAAIPTSPPKPAPPRPQQHKGR